MGTPRLSGSRFLFSLTLAALVTTGCIGAGASGAGSRSSDRSVITEEEIRSLPPGSALQVVRTLRSSWLRGRSATLRTDSGRQPPSVFLNDRYFGALSSLEQISSESIAKIRFITAADATTRFGTGYPSGIILVTSKTLVPNAPATAGLGGDQT